MDAIQSNSALQRLTLSSLAASQLSGRQSAATATTAASPTTTPSTTGTSTSPTTTRVSNFDALVYQSQMQRTSMALKYSEAAAQANADGSQAQTASNQFEFEFASESRSEELAFFSQRISEAAEGLSQAQQTQLRATSQSLAFRFKMSVKMSGETLQSFGSAAKALKSTGDASLDKFLALTKKMLGKDDDTLNDALKFLDKMLKGTGSADEKFQKLLEDLSMLSQVKQGGGADLQAQMESFQFEFEFEFSFESNTLQIQQATVQQADPLVLDLDDDGIELSDHTQGAHFDITGTGMNVRTAFVNGGDAFLAYDRNANGRVDNGTELFGDQRGASNGYEELRKFDSNGDGVISAKDRDFGKLQVFRDNGNGITEDGELMSLKDAGIAEISLNYANENSFAAGGNRVAQAASYSRHDGSVGRAADVLLNFIA